MSRSKTAARPSTASCYEGDASHRNAVCRVALEFSEMDSGRPQSLVASRITAVVYAIVRIEAGLL